MRDVGSMVVTYTLLCYPSYIRGTGHPSGAWVGVTKQNHNFPALTYLKSGIKETP